ncbi:hypothetical protein W97_01579 [Coniosporium apollinis CBS 100218]|uniref:AMP-activated protein kinase glycogen-binding domain-containing protein n=1 Tax=Coniosporium apollinis (strain CBS 100218) TaxID=1168221 RepID=R7YKA4_CONA1|nr:uncharacterized protein W97_01579 [Coniosporium apollinis CBS 100218]EON62357.1 hypothetical protein W97_01579 [Coniosporium apollinis CBS 100218]
MASTALIAFLFECPAALMTVELFGSWDNFSRAYRMEKDSRKGPCTWSGCHTFQNIICDGDPQKLTEKRDGGLKMGGTYWYYYKLDGDSEYHDPSQPSTTACPLLPGQRVNILEVPSDGGSSSELHTQNPQDRYRNPIPPITVPSKVIPASSQLPASQRHAPVPPSESTCRRASPIRISSGSVVDASSPERSSSHKRGISLVSDAPVKVFKSALCHLKGFATPSVSGDRARGTSSERQQNTRDTNAALNGEPRRRLQQTPLDGREDASARNRQRTASAEKAPMPESVRPSSSSQDRKPSLSTATTQPRRSSLDKATGAQTIRVSSDSVRQEEQEGRPVTKALSAYSKALCEYTRAMTPPKAVLRNGVVLEERPLSQSSYMPTLVKDTGIEPVTTSQPSVDPHHASRVQSRDSRDSPSRRGDSSTGDLSTGVSRESTIGEPLTTVSASSSELDQVASSSLLPFLEAQSLDLHANLAQAREVTISKSHRPTLLRSHFSEWSNTSDQPVSPAERPATPPNVDDDCSPIFSSLDGSSGRSSPNRHSTDTQVTITQVAADEDDLSRHSAGMSNPQNSQSAASALLDLYFNSSAASELNPFDTNLGQPYATPISESPQIGIALGEPLEVCGPLPASMESENLKTDPLGVFGSSQSYSLPHGETTSQSTLTKGRTHRAAFIMPESSHHGPLLHQPLDGTGHNLSITAQLMDEFAYLGDVVN